MIPRPASQVAYDIAAEAMRPLVLDRDGQPIHRESQVIAPAVLDEATGNPARGIVTCLKQQRGLHFAVVLTRYGDTFQIQADELLVVAPCPSCGGDPIRQRWTPGARQLDPQTQEECPACEGSGIEGGWPE